MKLFELQVPEVAHLPSSEKEAVLKYCVQSERFQRYRKLAPKIVGWALLPFLPVFIYLDWSPFRSAIAIVPILLILVGLKIYIEFRILRQEARRHLSITK